MATTTASSRHARARPPRPGPTTPRVLGAVAQLLIFTGAAAVIGLWWSDTTSVVGLSGWLTDAGRVTGLLAGYACAVLLALMSRIPVLERTVGSDRLARWHALGGRYTISLTLAHAVLITLGYAASAHAGVVEQATTLVLGYPDMLSATAGLALLLATGVISARAARRRLSYETWHYLHFATYLAIFLAFSHQLSNGADFVGHRPAQLAWYALYIGVAALLVWYRFLTPLRRGLRHRLTVTEVRPEAPGVVSVLMTGLHLDELGARPGQFFRWRFLAPGMWWTANPYSLSAPPDRGPLRITVKAVGRHSEALARLRPGTRVWAEGPYGAFTAARRTSSKVLLLAGGVGITPLLALFETLPGDVTLLYRARRPQDLALRGEIDAIAVRRGAAVHYVVDEPAGHASPLTADALTALVPDLSERDVYLCGPPGMTSAAIPALRRAKVSRRRIHHESFAL
ncbi:MULTISPECIES: ferredoxin reductase family protein [unclassified Streptomyces]|jgi:ferredoxin-NADP reductase/DMSO/TMAO reductase YedYZ heme-binding membrane subunit|uniref:ferredoxin reductase family protein n=1 Tax=unclassified Streptomyces TaxID=2593676 RepID=UPI000E1C6944|nr:ferredoxin reductase family protein [Streptomyces sp. M7]RDS65934.1 ferric reductase [Streptomyces sp. M7]